MIEARIRSFGAGYGKVDDYGCLMIEGVHKSDELDLRPGREIEIFFKGEFDKELRETEYEPDWDDCPHCEEKDWDNTDLEDALKEAEQEARSAQLEVLDLQNEVERLRKYEPKEG